MTGLIVGRAYEPGRGMCMVEQIRPMSPVFRLIPERNPNNRVIRHRDRIQWRSTRKAA